MNIDSTDARLNFVNLCLSIERQGRPGGGRTVKLHHVDLIAGDILGIAPDRATITNPTTKLVKTFEADQAKRDGDTFTFTHVFKNVKQSFYVRTRATNRDLPEPQMDSSHDLNPWDDLWCYSNPVMIRVRT